ncbi:MAG: AraC family transcriptional regulator [Hyphomicrobiales bacterium]
MTARSKPVSDDPLSSVLGMIRLSGAVFLDNHFTAPWAVLSSVTPQDYAPYHLNPRQLVGYHLIVEGSAYVALPDSEPVIAKAGDAIIIPRNDPHVMASALDVPLMTVPDSSLPRRDGGVQRCVMGGGGAATRVYCGFLATADDANPVFDALPKLLKISMQECESYGWIESSIRFAMQEIVQGRLASSSTMSRLAELLLVEALRMHIAESATDYGWLGGFRDRQVGRALGALHQDIAQNWTVDMLAKVAGMSRTAFSNRFSELTGLSPIRYLADWRMRAAQTHLKDGGHTIASVAAKVGYESEEAFSRAFKRYAGESPALWRSRERAGV